MNVSPKKLVLIMAAALLLPLQAMAAEIAHSTVGVQGYDLVTYFGKTGPQKGNGNHVAAYEGVNYLFATDANKKTFQASPAKYLPAYGGWCAIGVTFNKKIISDPLAWKIVDGKLYLNLDSSVQKLWMKDIPCNITKADTIWKTIADKDPSAL